jgi:DNA-binding NarL/FixJ family response regulator
MINVILADHERIFRIGMASALAAEDDIRIVGQPSTVSQLLHGVEKFRPHVLIVSSAFLASMEHIKEACLRQRTAILLLQDYGDTSLPRLSTDFHGVMRRSADENTVIECVRQLARGGRVIRLSPPGFPEQEHDSIGLRVRQRLTEHELDIVAHVVQGYKNREIAVRLGTTEPSVKNSLRKIFDKTGVYGRLELALFAVHHRTLAAGRPHHTHTANRTASMASLQRYFDAVRRPTIQ